MVDKNNRVIKDGDICISHDRYGGKWYGTIDQDFFICEIMYFCTNYQTLVLPSFAKELEVVGNVHDNAIMALMMVCYCNPLVYGCKKLIWNVKYRYNNKYKKKQFTDNNGEIYY